MGQALLLDPAQRAAARYLAEFQVPLLPERRLTREGEVEQILRAGAGRQWSRSAEFPEVARRYRNAMRIPAAAHCALEYYRWVGRSQLRFDGRRLSRAVDRAIRVPVLQLHGLADPYVLERTARRSACWAGDGYRYEVLPGIGHFVQQEAPQRTTALLTEFLTATD